MKQNINLGIDLYASKELTARSTEYLNARGMGVTLRKRANEKISADEKAIKTLETVSKESALKIPQEQIDALQADIASTRQALSESLKKEATFTWSDADKKLYTAYAEGNFRTGLSTWLKAYGYSLNGQTYDYFLSKISGAQGKSTNKRFVNNDELVRDVRTRTNFLDIFYGSLVEAEMSKGVIKTFKWADDIRKAFAPKPRKSAEQKSAQ